MEDRSVRRAGLRLGVTQSAISHALNRLRYHLNDEVFVRTRAGMIPTARALEISGPLRDVMRTIEATLGEAQFDPHSTQRRFVLAANDVMTATVGARLMAILATEAPNVDLVIRPVTRIDLAEQIDMGLIDVALGVFADVPSRFRSKPILQLRDTAVLRENHPAAAGLSLETLSRCPIAAVSFGGPQAGATHGYILERGLARQSDAFDRIGLERALAEIGSVPRYALLTPHFTALPSILHETDLVAIVPDLLAPLFRAAGIVARPLPYGSSPVAAKLVWLRRADADLGHMWLRGVLARSATES
ncbi:MAG: LysR family transcriptional regulator, partial [Hyphomicrobiales bacterium]|nr:LysR family transcriptional regulator [Hyphomicrobiales bacterium]